MCGGSPGSEAASPPAAAIHPAWTPHNLENEYLGGGFAHRGDVQARFQRRDSDVLGD